MSADVLATQGILYGILQWYFVNETFLIVTNFYWI